MDTNNKMEGVRNQHADDQENAAANLWKDSLPDQKLPGDHRDSKMDDASAQKDAYSSAIKSALDAESGWRHAFPDSAKSVTQDELKARLGDPAIDASSRGYLQFLNDNFDKLAGLASAQDKMDSSKISLNDVAAAGAMNDISPEHMHSGVKF